MTISDTSVAGNDVIRFSAPSAATPQGLGDIGMSSTGAIMGWQTAAAAARQHFLDGGNTTGANQAIGPKDAFGLSINAQGVLFADFGATTTTAFTLAAGKTLSAAAGAGAVALGAMTGTTTLPTGSFSWTGAAGANITLSTFASGGETITTTSSGVTTFVATTVIAQPSVAFQINDSGGQSAWSATLNTSNLDWTANSSQYNNVNVGLSPRTSDTATFPMTVFGGAALPSAATNLNGGPLHLQGGAAKTNGSSGLRGPVRLQIGQDTAETLIEAVETVVGQRAVALCQIGSGISATQLPVNSGDGIIYIANAHTTPTASSVGGGILYCTAGSLRYRGSAGTDSLVASA